jgi:hypothetical protein
MNSIVRRCGKIAAWVVICAGITLVGTAPAHAQFFFAGNFAFSCGPVNQPLGPVHLS